MKKGQYRGAISLSHSMTLQKKVVSREIRHSKAGYTETWGSLQSMGHATPSIVESTGETWASLQSMVCHAVDCGCQLGQIRVNMMASRTNVNIAASNQNIAILEINSHHVKYGYY